MKTNQKEFLSRMDFVLMVANTDGGAHVDPQQDEKYSRIQSGVATSWFQYNSNGQEPIKLIERAYIRHIAFEALVALEKEYQRLIGKRLCLFGSMRQSRYCCLRGASF